MKRNVKLEPNGIRTRTSQIVGEAPINRPLQSTVSRAVLVLESRDGAGVGVGVFIWNPLDGLYSTKARIARVVLLLVSKHRYRVGVGVVALTDSARPKRVNKKADCLLRNTLECLVNFKLLLIIRLKLDNKDAITTNPSETTVKASNK